MMDGLAELRRRRAAIDALASTAAPGDADAPSAAEGGAAEFLERTFLVDRPDELGRALAALDAVAADGPLIPDDSDVAWLATLIVQGYWADPGGLGNRGAASWAPLDYQPEPVGGWRISPVEQRPRTVDLARLAERYDVVVVGSGAGGSAAAAVLSDSGRRVLVVERGRWPGPLELWGDHLRNARAELGWDPVSGPSTAGSPRLLDVPGAPAVEVGPTDPRWGNNAMTAGGGTRVYGAQAWRFASDDFRMATRYGVPEGSSLADWPIGVDDLAPWYDRAERELGVSGAAPSPMPPIPPTRATGVLRRGADALGLSTVPVPLLINSTEYDGRPACVRCGACVGFACPAGAKAGGHNTYLRRALATGRVDLLLETAARRLTVDARGRVDGVELADDSGAVRRVAAGEVVVAAGAIESARLLLASAHPGEPDGMGNGTDQVGRHLQAHIYGGAIGVFDEVVVDGLGPGPSIATLDHRHGTPGVVGGGLLADEFVPTPVSAYRYLTDAGFIPRHGEQSVRLMRRYWPRLQRIVGPVHEVTSSESRVRIDPARQDSRGMPVAVLSGDVHPEDRRTQAFLSARAAEWLTAAGASRVSPHPVRGAGLGPSAGTHQAGTLRMGTDPARSATDPLGRVWGHPNVRVADGSLHVTNSGVNPVLTIFANALRIADDMTR